MSWTDNGLTIFFGRDAIQIDPISVAALCALIAVCLLVFAFRHRGGTTKCAWKRVRENTRTPFTKWRCRTCVMEAFTTDQQPPKECKRQLRASL